jgi:hypothetical protein
MKTGNYKEVYVTRDTSGAVKIWNPNIGIAKFVGCVEFWSARSVTGTSFNCQYIGLLDDFSDAINGCKCGVCTNERRDMKEALPFIPRKGTAWLYNTTTGKRTRVDKDMALIDPDTGKVIG